MPFEDELIRNVGFLPNSGRDSDTQKIVADSIRIAYIRSWLVKQGIPRQAATSALPESVARAYVNHRYLLTWRNRLNPGMALLGGDEGEEENGLNPSPPPKKEETSSTTISEAWLETLYAQIDLKVKKLVSQKVSETRLSLGEDAKQAIRDLAKSSGEAAARKILLENLSPRQIEIRDTATAEIRPLGLQHEKFPLLLQALQATDHRGFALNIWLTGPTGSGKTSAAESAAKALNVKFGSDGSLDADYKVLGFRDANGNVISTQFLDIYENGGIYVADEIDNWLPSALLSLNAALANGWVSSPRGLIQRHRSCRVIACANTWGLGATSDYVGRTRLDAASLDRFQPKIDWPYDEKLERAIANNMAEQMGTEWHDIIVTSRAAARRQGLKIIISPRATFNGIALLQAGFSVNEVALMTFAAGLSEDQKRAIGVNNIQLSAALVA